MRYNNSFEVLGEINLSPKEFVSNLLYRAVSNVNSGVSMTLTARKTTEIPPQDTRHLTDTRTRVSTLLEYSVAYEMNHILADDEHGHSVSAVLWNVFPDLIVRDELKNNVIGLEVKALHTAAEEKSANLSTPIQVIRRGMDFVVVLIWGWQSTRVNGVEITYPHIHEFGIFDAWILAKVRDYGWLYNHGGRKKAIDLCSPLIDGKDGRFKAEEGNMGKLTRIYLPSDIPKSIPCYEEMINEYAMYRGFVQKIIVLGIRESFYDVCSCINYEVDSYLNASAYPSECQVWGRARRKIRTDGEKIELLVGRSPAQWLSRRKIDGDVVYFWLSPKLEWKVLKRSGYSWEVVAGGNKPDTDTKAIQEALM